MMKILRILNLLVIFNLIFSLCVSSEELPQREIDSIKSGIKPPFSKLDITPPTTPVVNDDGEFTNDNTKLHLTFSSEDPQSGIAEYKYCLGTNKGSCDTLDWTSTGLQTEVTVTGLNLADAQTYYFSVKARNNSQFTKIMPLWSQEGYSDGISVDISAPQIIVTSPQDGAWIGKE